MGTGLGYLAKFNTVTFADMDSAVKQPNLHSLVNEPGEVVLRIAHVPPYNLPVDLDGTTASAIRPGKVSQKVMYSGTAAQTNLNAINALKGTKSTLSKYFVNGTTAETTTARLLDIVPTEPTRGRLADSKYIITFEITFQLFGAFS